MATTTAAVVVAVVAVVEVVVVVVATDPTTTLVDKISWWVDPGYLKFFVGGSLRIFTYKIFIIFVICVSFKLVLIVVIKKIFQP